jgi:hypothetical protein
MSLLKKSPKMSPSPFLSTLMCNRGEKWPKNFGLRLYFSKKKQLEENNHPIGENAPNLVALIRGWLVCVGSEMTNG